MPKTSPKAPKKLKELAYYQLSNGRILQIHHDCGEPTILGGTTYGGKVYCEDLFKKRQEVRRKVFANATLIDYHPSIPEIWKLAQTIQLDAETKKRVPETKHHPMLLWMDRLEFFFNKLIEFDYIKLRTLGYYSREGSSRRYLKEGLGRDIARNLANALYHGFDPKNDRTREWGKLFRTWASTGDDKVRAELFTKAAFRAKFVEVNIDRDCPITGQRFRWLCDGKAVWPHKRHLSKKESSVKVAELRAKYDALKAKETLTPKEEEQKAELFEIFEKEFGWMRAYEYTDLEKAQPFSKAYADPKTGEFPKAVVEIDVPTGKLVFANSLFDYLKDFPKEEEHSRENSVSHTAGRNNNVFFHARENQAFYVPLSNNMPHIWQNKRSPDKLRVGRASDEPRKGEWGYAQAVKGWVDRGYICTDLWAFHAVDRSRLPEKIEVDHFIVNLTPGRYRLINHFEHKEADNGIFCEIERVEDPKSRESRIETAKTLRNLDRFEARSRKSKLMVRKKVA